MNLTWLDPEMRDAIEAMTEPQRVATVLAGEARSEPIEGIVGVANVIRNRVKADLHNDGKPDWWGEGFSDVVTKRAQFSCLAPSGGKNNFKRVLQIAKAFAAKQPVTDPQVRQCVLVAHGVIDGYLVDNTRNATHYHTYAMNPKPSWAEGQKPVVRLGAHWFYAGIP